MSLVSCHKLDCSIKLKSLSDLAVYAAYPTTDSIKLLIGKSAMDAKSLSVSQAIFTPDTANDILQKAHIEMLSLSNKLPDEALSQDLIAGKTIVASRKEDDDKPAQLEQPEEKKESDAAAGLGSLFG